MRFGTAVCAAAVLGLVSARTPSNYAINKVRATKHKLESIHGKGLTGLYNLRGEFVPQRLGKGLKTTSRNRLGGASAYIAGIDQDF